MFEKYLYIARRTSVEPNENGIDETFYGKPQLYYFNYQPVSEVLELQQYGEDVDSLYRMFVDKNKYHGLIRVGDVAYLSDNETTESDLIELVQNEEFFGSNANYKIVAVAIQNLKMRIDLSKIK